MNFRFLHAADLHLDTPFQGIARVSPELGEKLKDASLDALDRLILVAIERDVHFVVIAGDLYDGAERGIRAQLRVRAALERLSDASIDTFIVHGNHDPVLEGWSAIRSWPEHVHVFSHDQVGSRELRIDDGLVTVSGISYPKRDVSENLARRFPRPTKPGFHVAVLHANVGASADHQNYSPCTVEELIQAGYDYWALGHIHKRQVLREATPAIVYPGNTQGRSFKASELGPKGAYLVTVDGDRITPDFIELGPIRFMEVEVSATESEDIADVADALMEEADVCCADGRDVVLRGRVVGPTSLYDDLTRPEAQDELFDALIDRTRYNAKLWWANLRLDVRPQRNLSDIADRDDLLGEVVRQGNTLDTDMDQLRFLLRDQPALRSWVDYLTEDELGELVEGATGLAVSLIDQQGG